MKRKELLREDIIKEKVKGGDCKTMPDTLYNILYEKSKVYGVRVLYEEDFPLDELTEFIQQEIDRAKEEGRKRLVNTIRRAIKENMNNGDTEDRHIQIDLDIVKILNDKDINKMFLEDSYSENLEDGGWGWYS